MSIDLIIKIAVIGLLVTILSQVLTRSGREEQATLTVIAGLVAAALVVVQEVADLLSTIRALFGL
ncbi:MAG: stage III sporulation protein AC [Oscillospiraceae bacterium]|nr:stage III sporulation protein AC [Oscillospiraceae bacterium]